MSNYPEKRFVYRIIDANLNRAKEGLRVCEELARFVFNSRSLAEDFKAIRHRVSIFTGKFPSYIELVKERDSRGDVGRRIYVNELERKNIRDIFFANIQRVKESIRVLEEFSKLFDKNIAVGLKDSRYRIYEIEKKITKKFMALSNRK